MDFALILRDLQPRQTTVEVPTSLELDDIPPRDMLGLPLATQCWLMAGLVELAAELAREHAGLDTTQVDTIRIATWHLRRRLVPASRRAWWTPHTPQHVARGRMAASLVMRAACGFTIQAAEGCPPRVDPVSRWVMVAYRFAGEAIARLRVGPDASFYPASAADPTYRQVMTEARRVRAWWATAHWPVADPAAEPEEEYETTAQF